jgi:hypothetical protein
MFTLAPSNQLRYKTNRKSVIIDGDWELTINHEVKYIPRDTKSTVPFVDSHISFELINVEPNNLVISLNSRDENGLSHIQLLKLSGEWHADEYNQLCFNVTRKQSPNTLVFTGSWQVNDNQQIIYTYERAERKIKDKSLSTLAFTGFWELSAANRLTYILAQDSNSRFDFRAQIETPNLYPAKGQIKYRLGTGVRRGNKGQPGKIVTLYGAWKFNRRLGLTFTMDCGNGKIYSQEFGVDYHFNSANKITCALKNKEGDPLGVTLSFTHEFLKEMDAETFIRLKRSRRDYGIEAGVTIPF